MQKATWVAEAERDFGERAREEEEGVADGNAKLAESTAEMGADVMVAWTVEYGCTDVGNVLHCSSAGGAPLQVGDMGHVPVD